MPGIPSGRAPESVGRNYGQSLSIHTDARRMVIIGSRPPRWRPTSGERTRRRPGRNCGAASFEDHSIGVSDDAVAQGVAPLPARRGRHPRETDDWLDRR